MKGYLFGIIFLAAGGCGLSQQASPAFDIVTLHAGKGAASVEVFDFNKDGQPDIVVANSVDSSVSIFLGSGSRKFIQAQGSPYYAGYFPNDVNIADFNNDGNTDLAIANHEKKYFTVLVGNGKGQFAPFPNSPFRVRVRPHTHGIISADFNQDSNLDVATDSWGVDSIVVLSGDGRGGFSKPVYHATGNHPYQRLRTADVNNDGKPDIITTNLEANDVSVLIGDGKGKFQQLLSAAGSTPFGVATGQFNSDNHLDLAVINSPSLANVSSANDGLTILLNDGKGKFLPMKGSPFRTGAGPSRVATGDVNNDGVDDVVVTNYKSADFFIYYLSNNGAITIHREQIGDYPDGVAISDLDGDGKKDIIVSSSGPGTITIFFTR